MGCRTHARDGQSLGRRCARGARSQSDGIYEVDRPSKRFAARRDSAAKSSVGIGNARSNIVAIDLISLSEGGEQYAAAEVRQLS